MTDDEKDARIEELEAETRELREALSKALAACDVAQDSARDAKGGSGKRGRKKNAELAYSSNPLAL